MDEQLTREYFTDFAKNDEELYVGEVDNAAAAGWAERNIPLFSCSRKELERIYYYRWWTFPKHLFSTPEGKLISEFLPKVPWAGKYNTINCALGFHLREARWLRNERDTTENYLRFWLEGSGDVQSYSCWIAQTVLDVCNVLGNETLPGKLLQPLTEFYEQREKTHLHGCGLFWSDDDRDAMEFSISGKGLRPTLNSYMYANARAIAAIAWKDGQEELAQKYDEKVVRLRERILRYLWDPKDQFFKVIPLNSVRDELRFHSFEDVPEERNAIEEIGLIPWQFHLPDEAYASAFERLKDEKCFKAPYGPTTADQSHPRFMYPVDHECLWNGPVWPFATSQTLLAAANLLQDGKANGHFSRENYLELLETYARSHRRETKEGRVIPWIDEDQDPYTGEWISRKILEEAGWPENIGGYERGKDYNHSEFCDLIITGYCGVVPLENGRVKIQPLCGENDWFRLEKLPLRGKLLTVQYDGDGTHFGKAGLIVEADGVERNVSVGLDAAEIKL